MQGYHDNYARIGVVPNANRSFGRNAAPDQLQVGPAGHVAHLLPAADLSAQLTSRNVVQKLASRNTITSDKDQGDISLDKGVVLAVMVAMPDSP